MPKRLIIISDMQFDTACGHNIFTNLEVMQAKFRKAGYTMPTVVFWNVRGDSYGVASPASQSDRGVIMLSGFSKSMVTLLLEGGDMPTPYDIMLKAIGNERYDRMTDGEKSR